MEFLGKKPWKGIISVSFLCSNLTPGQYSIGITKTSNCVDWVGYILYDTFRFPMRFNSYNGRCIYNVHTGICISKYNKLSKS